MMEWLSQRLRGWQNNDPTRANFGSVQSGFQETVMAAWAWSEQLRMQARLGRSLDISVTQALTRAVEWLIQQSSRYVDGLWMTNDGLRAHALGGLNVPEANAQLEVVVPALSAALGSATVGAGMPAVLTSTLRQDAPAGVEPTLPSALVSVQVPAGWQVVQAPTHLPAGRLAGHGDLIVVPPAGTAPGTYNVMMTAVMTGYPQVTAQAIGRVTVLGNGLVVNVRPTTQTVNTGDSFEFEVLVTNAGMVADQVVVSATGMLASHTTLVWDTGSGVVAATASAWRRAKARASCWPGRPQTRWWAACIRQRS